MNKDYLMVKVKDTLSDYDLERKIAELIMVELYKQRQQDIKEFREIINLYGDPRCSQLHHSKKHRHEALENCPVEAEINKLIEEIK